ncbi:MAG: hypothetical protein JWN02_2265 [Acidobacteria bacterium]|nr:hypothetical protein [Acidobacteriota bacterium]
MDHIHAIVESMNAIPHPVQPLPARNDASRETTATVPAPARDRLYSVSRPRYFCNGGGMVTVPSACW